MALAMNWASGCSAPATNDPQGTGGSNSSTAGTTGNGGNSATAGTTGSAGNSATAGTTGNGGNASGGTRAPAIHFDDGRHDRFGRQHRGQRRIVGHHGPRRHDGQRRHHAGSAGTTGRGGTTGSAGTMGSAGTTGAGGTGIRMDQDGFRSARRATRRARRRSTSTSATCASSTTAGAPTRSAATARSSPSASTATRPSAGPSPARLRRLARGSRLPRGRVRRRAVRHDQLAADHADVFVDDAAPIQLNDLNSASVNLDNFFISVSGNAPYWDDNFEFWISKNDPRTSTDGGVYAEIIMFTGWHASRLQQTVGWPCDKSGSVTAGSNNYNLCHQSDTWSSGWRFFNFNINQGPYSSLTGKMDVKALLDFVRSKYSGFTDTMWLTRIEVGTEVDDNTSGTAKSRTSRSRSTARTARSSSRSSGELAQ